MTDETEKDDQFPKFRGAKTPNLFFFDTLIPIHEPFPHQVFSPSLSSCSLVKGSSRNKTLANLFHNLTIWRTHPSSLTG